MDNDVMKELGAIREAIRRPGLTLRTIELVSKLESDVASILGAPPVPVPRFIYGRSVSAKLRRGTIRES